MSEHKQRGEGDVSVRRDRHWLIARRVRDYPRLIIGAYAISIVVLIVLSQDMIDPLGRPLGGDFVTFWASSYLTLSGEPASAFDVTSISAAEHIAAPGSDKLYLWHYPPTFMLIVAPLALLPYIASLLVWILLTLSAFVATVRMMAPSSATIWLTLAFPGTYLNFMQGQNGFLSATLFGGSIYFLDKRPILAGMMIGLLSYKPHLGLLFPLILICGRHWIAFFAASVTTIVFALVSFLVLGLEVWRRFIENISLVRWAYEQGALPWGKMPGLFAAARLLGVDVIPAYAFQGMLTLAVTAVVAWVWWRRTPIEMAGSVLATAALLVTPYLFDYDLVILAIPIALLGWCGYRDGWLPWEREVLVLSGLAPMFAPVVAETTNLQITLFALLAMFAIATRRAAVTRPAL